MATPYPKLSAEARRKRLEYLRKWRQAHPDKTREYYVRYWERQALKKEQESDKGEN